MSFQKLLKFPSSMQVAAEKRWILNEAKKIGLKNLALRALSADPRRTRGQRHCIGSQSEGHDHRRKFSENAIAVRVYAK